MIFDLIFSLNLFFLSFFGTKEIRFSFENIQNFHRDFPPMPKPFYFIFVIFILFWGVTQKLGYDNKQEEEFVLHEIMVERMAYSTSSSSNVHGVVDANNNLYKIWL